MKKLQTLLDKEVISQATFDWIDPLLQEELRHAEQVQQASSDVFHQLFKGHDNQQGSDEDSDDDNNDGEGSLNLWGTEVKFVCDTQSVGHGNRVWHASIATCMYLRGLLQQVSKGTASDKHLRMLELGAGTAIPSLFVVNMVTELENFASFPPLLVHVTDAKNFRNVKQIIASTELLKPSVLTKVQVRVSPLNWGEGLSSHGSDDSSFWEQESPVPGVPNSYDWVVVSDCIYNPDFHGALLESIVATLKFPRIDVDTAAIVETGGTSLVSFSLHGNTPEENIWQFFERAPLMNRKDALGQSWRLQAKPVLDWGISNTENFAHAVVMPPQRMPLEPNSSHSMDQSGWHMEETMKSLDLWAANVEPRRWLAFLYEITWCSVCD